MYIVCHCWRGGCSMNKSYWYSVNIYRKNGTRSHQFSFSQSELDRAYDVIVESILLGYRAELISVLL